MVNPEDIPETLAIFPLQGALLLPRGRLPLNIFEPRYKAMVEDAMAGDRLIGMIQPLVKETLDSEEKPEIYGTGCIGKITSFSETDDGRYLITLTGICRFEITRELPAQRGYRRVTPKVAPYLRDFEAPVSEVTVDRDRLVEAMTDYFSQHDLAPDWESVNDTPTADLVAAMAMLCPFTSSEKQALLETDDLADRARVMIALMEMGGHDDGETPRVTH